MFGFGKGKIEVFLEKYNFKPGETIKGRLNLKLKKPIQARQLRVSFYGLQTQTSTGISAMGPERNRNNASNYVYKFDMPLDGEKEYLEGEYNFEIAIPADVNKRGAMPGGTLGTALQAAQFLSGTISRTQWYVEAALDIPKGIDVKKKVQVNIV